MAAASIDLDATADAVRQALLQRGLARPLAVAAALVQRVYGGDIAGFRSREGKAISLRRLTDHGVPMSPAALYRCLSVHEIWVRTGGDRWPKLGASHYRAVESLVSSTQAGWLHRAAKQGWSAAHLRQAIRVAGVRAPDRGGRLPEHPVARFVTRVARELTMLDRIAAEVWVQAEDKDAMVRLAGRLDELAARCRAHAVRLAPAVPAPVPPKR